jgi:phosphoglycerol transferase MdoB-like AlkP superfamily enzyme
MLLLKTIFYGFRLDLTFFGYILLFSIVFYLHPALFKISKWVFAVVLLLQIIITTIDINLFTLWQHTINYQFFEYLKHPSKALGNSSKAQNISGILIIVSAAIVVYVLAIQKHPNYQKISFKSWKIYLLLPVSLVLAIVMSRGGVQVAPANLSFAFFGNKQALNYAAINSSWNFMFAYLNGQTDADIASFQFFDNAKKLFNKTFNDESKSQTLVKSKKPNIVIIMLESFSANLVGACDADENCTPHFNQIAQNGILFKRAYSSGNRTDKGLAAVVSGFPAQATASIITIPSKAQKLPSIFKVLKKEGYHSTFYYGGEPEFANKKAYLLNAGVDKLKIGFNYPLSAPRGKWGVHDEVMFHSLAKDIIKEDKPFCKLYLSLSSHEPFDYPQSNANSYNSPTNFRNSIRYTDSCLGAFWKKVKSVPNTIYIFLADHGRIIEKEDKDQIPSVNQIPILIAGSALKDSFKGKAYNHVINQHHLPSNLLNIMGIDYDEKVFKFQGNWFNPLNKAYLTFYNGVALTDGSSWYEYQNETKKSFLNGKRTDSAALIDMCKLYQQRVMEEFGKY